MEIHRPRKTSQEKGGEEKGSFLLDCGTYLVWIPRLPPISSDRLDCRWKKKNGRYSPSPQVAGGGALVTGRHSRFNATKGRVGCDLLVSLARVRVRSPLRL